jgi:diadenosine tetraphosphatase ApaH/serine/threonine PP2A family protein phosphatase
MLWIRGEFLNSTVEHGKIVVHGHTITDLPEVRDNRIGIDTGAFFSERLTCLVLDGADRRFLHTGPRG